MRKGSGDKRDLWPECIRAIRGVRPNFALFENVPGILSSDEGKFFNRILADLAEAGYDAEWKTLSASEVGARHKRDRIWIVAYSQELRGRGRNSGGNNKREEMVQGEQEGEKMGSKTERRCEQCENIPYSHSWRLEGANQERWNCVDVIGHSGVGKQKVGEIHKDYWILEPDLGVLADGLSIDVDLAYRQTAIRVADRLPERVNQLKGLGNSIVPQCAAVIMRDIKSYMERLW